MGATYGHGFYEAAQDPESPADGLDHSRVEHARGDPRGHFPLVLLATLPQWRGSAGLGSILDTVSKDTEDTAYSCIFILP